MAWEVSGIFFYAFVLSSSASVILSPSGSNATFCLGQTGQTFTCEVTGPFLFWEYTGGSSIPFSSGAITTRLLNQDIEVELLSICSAVVPLVRSMATVNVTSDINGTTLQCRNSSLQTGSTSQEVDFYVENTTAVSSIFIEAMGSPSNITIYVSWPMATCPAMYALNITSNNEMLQTVEDAQFMFHVTDSGIYTIAVNSVDYYGMSVGDPVSKSISINAPNFDVSPIISCMNETLSLIIEEEEDTSVLQLDVVSCVVSLTSDDYNVTRLCNGRKAFGFNVTSGDSYNYNVIITNLFSSLTRSGVVDTSICNDNTTKTPVVCPACPAIDISRYVYTSISFGALFGLALLFFIFERLRCFCPTASFWSVVFCDCLAKGDKKTKPFDAEEIPNKKPN